MNSLCSICLNEECTSWSTDLLCEVNTALPIVIGTVIIIMGILFIVTRLIKQ